MLKIAHVFQAPGIRFFEPEAAQLHIYHTMHGLQQAGHEVTLLALQGRYVLVTDNLNVFQSASVNGHHYGRLGISGTTPFKFVESGIRRTQQELRLPYLAMFDSYRTYDACCRNLDGYDLIHERYNLLSVGGALASRRLGIPFVLEVNADLLQQRRFKGQPERGIRRSVATRTTHFCFDAASKIICVSEGLRQHLQSHWNVDPQKLAVLPCAADIDVFGRDYDSDRVRRELGLTAEPVVIWVGGFYDWHDLDLLIESFGRVLDQVPDAKLVLVGDGETRPRIERKVNAEHLQHAVITTGRVAHERVPELLSCADVAVAPSPPLPAHQGGTGTPLKLFEYMAAGKAIVATSANQATAVVRHGQTGLLVPPADGNAFSQAILRLLQNPEERRRLGQNARRHAAEEHSWYEYTRRLEAIYRSLI